MDFFKAIVLQLISPLNLSLVTFILSLVFVYFQRHHAAKLLRYFSLFWLLLCSQPYFSDLLLYPLEYHEVDDTTTEPKPDFIFVLACYYGTQGNVSEISRWSECSLQRNVEAARLHFITDSPILITGGNFLVDKDVNYTEKAIDLFLSLNVPETRLVGTFQGTTTQEEIQSARTLLASKKVWVVSSATHISRLKSILEPIVDSAHYFPVDYQSKSQLTPYLTMPSQQALENTRIALYAHLSALKHSLTSN